MDLLNHEFILFLTCALKNNLKYLLVGGYAVNYHGYSRNTRDLDVWLQPENENRDAFINTLLCMEYSENEVSPLREEDFRQPFKATVGSADASIDVLTFFDASLHFEDAYSNKEVYEIEKDIPANFVSYEVLIEMKLKAQRPKDFHDIAELDRLRNLKK